MLKIGVVIVAALAAAWFVIPDARAWLIGIAPFALIAICPLAMLFGMHAMGRGGDVKQHDDCCGSHTRPDTEKEKIT